MQQFNPAKTNAPGLTLPLLDSIARIKRHSVAGIIKPLITYNNNMKNRETATLSLHTAYSSNFFPTPLSKYEKQQDWLPGIISPEFCSTLVKEEVEEYTKPGSVF